VKEHAQRGRVATIEGFVGLDQQGLFGVHIRFSGRRPT
jgi:hypothetical protein